MLLILKESFITIYYVLIMEDHCYGCNNYYMFSTVNWDLFASLPCSNYSSLSVTFLRYDDLMLTGDDEIAKGCWETRTATDVSP